MKHILWASLFAVVLGTLLVTPGVTAQEPGEDELEAEQREMLLEYVARADRLRDFGYPLLARDQLDNAKAIDPTAREVLLGYLRLFTLSDADEELTAPYVKSLLELYPREYDSCIEIARFLAYTERPPAPPSTKTDDHLNTGLQRLAAEMEVYRELGHYINNPEGELPESAKGKPALSLAYLARCAHDTPGTAVVYDMAARDLDYRGLLFDRWSRTDEKLAEPFGRAAHELYQLALPLYRKAARNDNYAAGARINIANLLFRLGRFEDARKAIVAAEMLAPANLTTAETLQAIAEQTRDIDLLVEALGKVHDRYLDITSRLDLMAAERVRDNDWSFDLWQAWGELRQMYGPDRLRSIRALLREKPEFREVHFLDALSAMDFADSLRNDPDERARILQAALRALDRCEVLGDEVSDWHRLRGSCLWDLGKYESAADAYAETVKMDPRDTTAAQFARAASDIAEGLYTPEDYEIYRAQLEEWGDMRRKVQILERVVGRSPKFFDAQLLLGKAAFMTGSWTTAYRAYKAGHELIPENLECLDGAARAAMRSERYREAYEYFKKLNELEENYEGAERWENLIKNVLEGGKSRERAFQLWLESTGKEIAPTKRQNLLEEAIYEDPGLAEPRIEMAAILRSTIPKAARSHLEACLADPRDKYVRASAYRELGRLELNEKNHSRAVAAFENAYSWLPGDGTDLLLAAMALHDIGDEKGAAERMRRLFRENPTSGLLRPKPEHVNELNLIPVQSDQQLTVHPGYDVGDKISFEASVSVQGEGGGQDGQKHTAEYELNLEVTAKPMHGGVWKFKLGFARAPSGFEALNRLKGELVISPWFGMIEDPALGDMSDVVNPALQAVAEAFTTGIGDVPLAPPYVWKNDLTSGPPHFGGDSLEGSFIAEKLGDSIMVIRRANAGRTVGDTRAHQNFSRGLETVVRIGGAKNAVREVTMDIARKGLTSDKDDVVLTWLQIRLVAK